MTISLKTFARRGGQARSRAKTLANRAKMRAYWKSVRGGLLPAPRRPKSPPTIETIARAVKGLSPRYGVTKLELFGSVARGEARRGSDIDLIATFGGTPGLEFVEFHRKLEESLGRPVDLLDAQSVAEMTNPYRRAAINADRKVIYEKN